MEKDKNETLSIKLCTILEDIGVTKNLVKLRRYVSNLREVLASDKRYICHIFGSQIEGSTTVGMHSDNDYLCYFDGMTACTNLSECKTSKHSYLAIKTTMSCPQCYSLQLVINLPGNLFVPASKGLCEVLRPNINYDMFMLDEDGRVFLSNKYIFNCWLHLLLTDAYPVDTLQQHGPAFTWSDGHETVWAINCRTLPDECNVLFSRPKPGHWPKQVTLLKVKQCGVFFMHPGNIGHTFSYDSERKIISMNIFYPSHFASLQWRMSTNMAERLLMCDLDIEQLMTYTLTKMIRKQFLTPIVGDQLSTFHMKTALLFTVEKYPMKIWSRENLVHCVIHCLKTLRRFLQRRYCPHYSIASVNLFSEKLQVSDFPPLTQELTKIINSKLQCVYLLSTDYVNERLTTNGTLKSREDYFSMRMSPLFHLFRTRIHITVALLFKKTMSEKFAKHMKKEAEHLKRLISRRNDLSVGLEFVYLNNINTVATIEASACIADKKPITIEIYEMYERSLLYGQISNYLKYASMLVCTHQYDRAVTLLKRIERMITPDKVDITLLSNGDFWGPLIVTAQKLNTPNEQFKMFAAKIIMDVEFTRQEMKCVPSHFLYEMYRTVTEDDVNVRKYPSEYWMDLAVVDARPFMYYLQYLAQENSEEKKAAKAKLCEYCLVKITSFVNLLSKAAAHIESEKKYVLRIGNLATAYNMLGHILELENNLSVAWRVYVLSAKHTPYNNAAYWHMCRLFSQFLTDN